jgi:hypothetical protein
VPKFGFASGRLRTDKLLKPVDHAAIVHKLNGDKEDVDVDDVEDEEESEDEDKGNEKWGETLIRPEDGDDKLPNYVLLVYNVNGSWDCGNVGNDEK